MSIDEAREAMRRRYFELYDVDPHDEAIQALVHKVDHLLRAIDRLRVEGGREFPEGGLWYTEKLGVRESKWPWRRLDPPQEEPARIACRRCSMLRTLRGPSDDESLVDLSIETCSVDFKPCAVFGRLGAEWLYFIGQCERCAQVWWYVRRRDEMRRG